MPSKQLIAGLRPEGVLMDVKSALDTTTLPSNLTHWSL